MTGAAEKDALLALVGEPIQAYPEVWTLAQWWEWHGRLVRALIDDTTRVLPPADTACERCLRLGCQGECASVLPPGDTHG